MGGCLTGAMKNSCILLFLCGAVLAGCRDSDVVTAAYATLAEAEAAGAVERGWVPPGLPPSAQDLREAHDLDTNRRWGLFNFAPQDASILARQLVAPDDSAWMQTLRCTIPARIEWWPGLLRGAVSPEAIRNAGLEAYRTRDTRLVVMVNWKQGRAYYWGE